MENELKTFKRNEYWGIYLTKKRQNFTESSKNGIWSFLNITRLTPTVHM
jgi:hypothetical protein